MLPPPQRRSLYVVQWSISMSSKNPLKSFRRISATSKSFIGNSAIYFVGSTLSKLIGFLLLPLYTTLISPSDYGYYDLTITYVTVVAVALFFDLWISVMRFMHDEKNENDKASATLSGFIIFTGSTFAYLSLVFFLSTYVEIQYVWLIAAYGLLSNLATMYGFIARGYKKSSAFVISGVLATTVNALTAILLLAILKLDFSSLYIAAILGFTVQVAYLEFKVHVLKRAIGAKLNKKLTKNILIHTLPLAVNSAAFWLLTGYNRVIINTEMGVFANGIYAIAAKFVLAVTLITSVFNFAWQDILFTKAAKNEISVFYSKSSNLYILFLLVGGSLLLPTFNIVFELITDSSYYSAKAIIPLLVISALFGAYVVFQGSIFHSIKKTSVIFYSMLAASLVNVLLCALLINLFGLNGATLATIIGLCICVVIRMYMLRNLAHHRFEPFNALFGFLLVGSVLAYLYLDTAWNGTYLAVVVLVCLVLSKKLYTTYIEEAKN